MIQEKREKHLSGGMGQEGFWFTVRELCVLLDLTRKIKMRVKKGTEETAETSPQSNTEENRGVRKLF